MNILEQIKADLEEKGKTLTCDMFEGSVAIEHQDGSSFNLQNVIVEEKRYVQLDVYLVWTEHCGYFYFFKADLTYFRHYKSRGFKNKV